MRAQNLMRDNQYNLAQLAQRQRDFRTIEPPASQAVELFRLLRTPVAAWQTVAAGLMGAAYADAVSTGDAAPLATELDSANDEITAILFALNFRLFFNNLELWQRRKWLAEVQRAAGADVDMLLARPVGAVGEVATQTRAQRRAGGVVNAARVVRPTPLGLAVSGVTGIDAKLASAVASNVSLVKSVSDDTRARIANAVIAGVQQGQSSVEVARVINRGLRMSTERARRIAKSEVNKAVKALTMARFEEAGFDQAFWRHSANPNYREAHLARNGRKYALSDPVWGGLYEPFCGCWAAAVWPDK
jgi:SPP1 gp7 family putative phage head morphogenesis protein